MEIMHETVSCFIRLKKSGVIIEHALDIGAYRGEFTNAIKSVWQKIEVQQFEADERQAEYLQDNAYIVVLADAEKTVDIYTVEDTGWGSTTGTSMYKEKTAAYDNPIMKKVSTKTLDDLVDLSADWEKGLVKIDTQGSELAILEGAQQLLSKGPRYILLEASIREYNEGAPKINDVINYMKDKGYQIHDILDRVYINGLLYQANLFFEAQ